MKEQRQEKPWQRRLLQSSAVLSTLLILSAFYHIGNNIGSSSNLNRRSQPVTVTPPIRHGLQHTRRRLQQQAQSPPSQTEQKKEETPSQPEQKKDDKPKEPQPNAEVQKAQPQQPKPQDNPQAKPQPKPAQNDPQPPKNPQQQPPPPKTTTPPPPHKSDPITQGPAVATLTSNNDEDLAELCLALKSLFFLRGGHVREWTKSPVLIFNEGDLSDAQMARVSRCTSRPVAFPVVNLHAHPKNFDVDKEWEAFSVWSAFRPVRERHRWSYAAMIRFWTTMIWKHPAIQQYNVIMRIDTDSCFLWQRDGNLNNLYKEAPGLENRYVYQSNYENYVGGDTHFIEGLYDFAVEYMKKNDIVPQNPSLWNTIETTWREQRNLPVFQTNFEICRRAFFQRGDVARWHEALAEREPFGIYRRRWGDAQFRVITVALFAKEENLLLSKSTGYLHGRGRCAKNFISEIHEQLSTKANF